ncbi:hypothetical protein CSW78_27470, partial [Shigella flexneri]
KVKIIPLEVVLRNYTAGSFSKRFGVDEGIALETIQLRMKILLFQLTRTRRLLSTVSRRSRLQVRES